MFIIQNRLATDVFDQLQRVVEKFLISLLIANSDPSYDRLWRTARSV